MPRTGGGGGGSGGSIKRTCNSTCFGSGGSTTWNAGPSTKPNRKNRCTTTAPAIATMRKSLDESLAQDQKRHQEMEAFKQRMQDRAAAKSASAK